MGDGRTHGGRAWTWGGNTFTDETAALRADVARLTGERDEALERNRQLALSVLKMQQQRDEARLTIKRLTRAALEVLNERTLEREDRGVEGTHAV